MLAKKLIEGFWLKLIFGDTVSEPYIFKVLLLELNIGVALARSVQVIFLQVGVDTSIVTV